MYLRDAFSRLDELAQLPAGWLDGGGEQIRPEDIAYARSLLQTLHEAGVDDRPGIFPMEDGGISLEWLKKASFFSVEILAGIASTCAVDIDLHESAIEDDVDVQQIVDSLTSWLADR